MNKQPKKLIVVTGALGFIGSCLVSKLNEQGHSEIVLVDDFTTKNVSTKSKNIQDKKFVHKINLDDFFDWLNIYHKNVSYIFHIGACSATTEVRPDIFEKLNFGYSKHIWKLCVKYKIPCTYASSAATYGDGSLGYEDDHDLVSKLQPLNLYGKSKNDFDKWTLSQKKSPPQWVGLKFFNVYGPNEYHKDRMSSVIFHATKSIQETGHMNLFRSHKLEFTNGGQMRDFVYIKDVVSVCAFFMNHKNISGIFNVGTGTARTFLDLTKAVFTTLKKEPNITFVDTPKDIRNNYQYFTEAPISKLRSSGYVQDFTSLEDGIKDYINNYIVPRKYL